MKNYESLLVNYATFINDLEDVLSCQDWKERLNEIAEDIFLAYEHRKDLREDNEDLKKLDERMFKIGEKLKEVYPPAYEYFEKFFRELIPLHQAQKEQSPTVTKS